MKRYEHEFQCGHKRVQTEPAYPLADCDRCEAPRGVVARRPVTWKGLQRVVGEDEVTR